MAKAKSAAPSQVLLHPQTGEIVRECARCPELEEEIDSLAMALKGAERDINAWRIRYEELRRDKEAEAKAHELYDDVLDLFALWQRMTGRTKTKFSADRFFLAIDFLEKEGREMCERAIAGRVYDHFTSRRSNGSTVHYHEWERIFGSKGNGTTARDNFEESANRAPKDWREQVARVKIDIAVDREKASKKKGRKKK